jgi:hypothetical protein
MKKINLVFLLCSAAAFSFSPARAVTIDQYASSVIGFSSQYSEFGWSALKALGPSDTFGYGDFNTSWAPWNANGTLEYLTIGFSTPVYANSVTVRETWGNGFVYQIDAVDGGNNLHTVWTGVDPSLPDAAVDALFSWAQTSYLVTGVKIYVNTNHNLATWEEIDSVQLHGSDSVVPLPAALPLFATGAGLLGLLGWRKKRKAQVANAA